MAARRLLIVMLILLGISSILAIALPKPDRDDSPPEQSTVTGTSGATGSSGTGEESGTSGENEATEARADEKETDARAEAGDARYRSIRLGAGKPLEIEAEPGSRLVLTVRSRRGSVVEIEGLGLTGFADRYAPAVFDLILPPDPGRFRVRALEAKPGAVIDTAGP